MTTSCLYRPLSSSAQERVPCARMDRQVSDDGPEPVAAQRHDAPSTRYLVVDANVLVDLALELAGIPTSRRQALEALLCVVHQPELVVDGERVHLRVVLSKHIVRMAYRPLVRRGVPHAKAVDSIVAAARLMLGNDGLRDGADEDYKALGWRAWTRYGTDAEDEAVLRCAEDHTARILTNDREFAGYLDDRKVGNWSLDGFLDVLT